MKKSKDERGAISVIVLVTILFFIAILSGTYLINATVRKSQIKSQMILQDEYSDSINEQMQQNIVQYYRSQSQ